VFYSQTEGIYCCNPNTVVGLLFQIFSIQCLFFHRCVILKYSIVYNILRWTYTWGSKMVHHSEANP